MKTLLQCSKIALTAFLVFTLTFICGKVSAQDRPVTGKVTDKRTGESIIGASVKVKGRTAGTATGVDGSFRLNAPSSAILQITYLGYTALEIPAAFDGQMSVVMTENNQELDEIVVVGYGTQRRATLTGSVATVDSKVFQDRGVVSNPLSALQGQVPGVVVTRNTAAPGQEGWNFQIRGASSVNATDPLIVVDGITLASSSALNSINPSDIESMSVLKDAAAAIYGSRAAGGVVLITTKRAKSGKPSIEYNGSVSLKNMGLSPNFIKGSQYGELMLQAINNASTGGVADPTWVWTKYANAWMNRPASGYIDKRTPEYIAGGETIGFTDVFDYTFFDTTPYDILWGNGKTSSTQHDLNFSGRADNLGYRASFGYLDEGSMLKWGNNSNNRYNARINLDYKFSDRLNIQTNISFEKNDIVFPTRADQLNVLAQPGFPAATINGKPYAWGTQPARNWLLELGGDNESFNNRVFANTKVDLKIMKDLNLVAQGGYNWTMTDNRVQYKYIPELFNYTESYQYQGNPRQDQSWYNRENVKDAYFNTNAYLEYKKTIRERHNLSVTAGGSYEKDEYNLFSTRTNFLASNDVPALGLSLGDNTTRSNSEVRNHYALASGYGRLNYAFSDKYLLELNARYDATSKFNKGNRGIFYSGVSAGWRLTEEKFMENLKFLSEFKLRAAYGSVGNPFGGIGLYDYLQLIGIGNGGAVLGGYTSRSVTAGPSGSLVSLSRTWERINTFNLAVDFGLFKNRLNGTFEHYQKRNNNVLLVPVYASVLGASAPSENMGKLKVWGWETSLGWRDQAGKISYYINATLTNNNNELLSYGGANIVNAGQRSIEGYPLNSYFGLKYDGRIQNADEAAAYAAYVTGNNIGMPGTTQMIPGINRYKDLNGDGTITNAGAHQYLLGKKDANGNAIADGDMEYLGSPDPKYVFGLNLGGSWKNFDLSAIFQGVGKRLTYRRNDWSVPFSGISQGITDWWVGKTWTPANPDSELPVLTAQTNKGFSGYNTYNYQISDWSLQNGAYVRLKNLVLGYTFNFAGTKKIGIQRLRIYAAGNDLWELTKIKDGYDPEVPNFASYGAGRYPFYRLYSLGLNVTF